MTSRGGLFAKGRLLLTEEDVERLDRERPELSFTGRGQDHEDADRALSRLERLEALRGEGVLSDAEFNAAKARVLSQDRTPPGVDRA